MRTFASVHSGALGPMAEKGIGTAGCVEEVIILRRKGVLLLLLLLLGVGCAVGHRRHIGLGRARVATPRRPREAALRAIGGSVHGLLGIRLIIGIVGLGHVLLVLILGVSLIHGDWHALHRLLVVVGHRGHLAGLRVAVSHPSRRGGRILLATLREALNPGVVVGDTSLLLVRCLRGIVEHRWCAEHRRLGSRVR